ncbi:serine/threonine protein kinase [Aquabacterium sp.]|uniref:serine/threonine protein kinase n=1 Tax=Aquabacterium sp. TaxID=1872578 RepID=UPI0035AFAD1F
MTAVAPPNPPQVISRFGRYELRQMLCRTLAASTWLAFDPRAGLDVLLYVPRVQPRSPRDLDEWLQDVQSGARLQHPRLVEVLETGVHEGWPYASAHRDGRLTLQEHLAQNGVPLPAEAAGWMSDALEGLAYAHEAGVVHRDIGLHSLLIDSTGRVSMAGLAVGLMADTPGRPRGAPVRQHVREEAERDVLMAGLLLHRLLVGQPALDDPDLGSAAQRVGPEIVRLPWSGAHPIPDTLRAIVNRATDRQQRQRYLNARTLLSALQGWIKTNEEESGGPLALLLDRLNTVGNLPSRPRADKALLQSLGQELMRVDDIVEVITRDPGLVWELLRSVNTARFQNGTGEDRVTTITRAIVLLGQQGLRRVLGSLRPWPGALAIAGQTAGLEAGSAQVALGKALRRACISGQMARLLAPFSISDEESLVAAMSQRLGELLVLYHFPEEAAQIERLMQPGPPQPGNTTPTPGMSAEAAAGAVLGIDLTELSVAVMRHWGMDDRLQHAARPLNRTLAVRKPDDAVETLRAVASLADELADAIGMDPAKQQHVIHHCTTRYARALNLHAKECQEVLDTSIRLVDAPIQLNNVNP